MKIEAKPMPRLSDHRSTTATAGDQDHGARHIVTAIIAALFLLMLGTGIVLSVTGLPAVAAL